MMVVESSRLEACAALAAYLQLAASKGHAPERDDRCHLEPSITSRKTGPGCQRIPWLLLKTSWTPAFVGPRR